MVAVVEADVGEGDAAEVLDGVALPRDNDVVVRVVRLGDGADAADGVRRPAPVAARHEGAEVEVLLEPARDAGRRGRKVWLRSRSAARTAFSGLRAAIQPVLSPETIPRLGVL